VAGGGLRNVWRGRPRPRLLTFPARLRTVLDTSRLPHSCRFAVLFRKESLMGLAVCGRESRSSWIAIQIVVPCKRKPPENSSGRPTILSMDGLAPSANGIPRSPRCSTIPKPRPPSTAWQRPNSAITNAPTISRASAPPTTPTASLLASVSWSRKASSPRMPSSFSCRK
jgi:hypothetical protein